MGSIVEKISAFFKGGGSDGYLKKPQVKLINYLVMIGAAGVLLIILANAFAPSGAESPADLGRNPTGSNAGNSGETAGGTNRTDIAKTEEVLNRRLEEMLSRIEGAGEVKASVNLASTTEMEYAVNTTTSNRKTDEKDRQGGSRTITEVNDNGQLVLLRESEGSKEAPVVVREIKPEVRGVMVVAGGAGDPQVKADLIQALQVYLGIPVHKIVVLPREGR